MRKTKRSAEWGTPLDGICIRPIGVATLSTCWHEVPLAPSLRELLSEREAEGVSPVGSHAPKSFESVGEALSLPHPRILASIQLNGIRPIGCAAKTS